MSEEEHLNIVSWSGGTDSTVMLHWLLHHGGLENFKVIFADSTIIFPETLEYIEEMIQWLGIKKEFVRLEPKQTFWSKLEESKFWPSIRALWCRNFVKIAPIKAFYRTLDVNVVHDHVGVSKADSAVRAKRYSSGSKDYRVRGVNGLTQIRYVYPIIDWTDAQKKEYIKCSQIPLNPIYDTVGLSGCYCCPYYHPNEYKRINRYHPELIQVICFYERLIDKRCSPDFWLCDLDLDGSMRA